MEQSQSSGQTSSSLLDQAQRHDEEAWERLVSIYSPLVFHWCREGSGLSPDDAADAMQDVFRSVAASIGNFQKEDGKGTFRGWLRTITANKIRDLIRKKRGRAEAIGGTGWHERLQELAESGTDDESAAEEGLIMRRAVELLDSGFKEQSRQAFWLVVIDGLSAAEVAEQLDMTEQAVWQACYRIRRKLSEELANLVDRDRIDEQNEKT